MKVRVDFNNGYHGELLWIRSLHVLSMCKFHDSMVSSISNRFGITVESCSSGLDVTGSIRFGEKIRLTGNTVALYSTKQRYRGLLSSKRQDHSYIQYSSSPQTVFLKLYCQNSFTRLSPSDYLSYVLARDANRDKIFKIFM